MKLPTLILLLTLSFQAFSVSINVNCPGGYTDNKGSYIWFDEHNEEVFKDKNKVEWNLVAVNKLAWEEAVLIRKANAIALISLGFDSTRVYTDIELFEESSTLFTKLSKLENYSGYVKGWERAYNSQSNSFSSKMSSHIEFENVKTRLVLKFYPTKGQNNPRNSIGLVKKGFIPHTFEAFLEVLEIIVKKIVGSNDPNSDLIYDMHLRNSKKLLRKDKKSRLQK